MHTNQNAYNIRPNGLGIIITQLCFLLAMGRSVTAVVSNPNNIIFDLKRIFDIGDDRLMIETGTHGFPDLETDELCTYAPYFETHTVNLFGQQWPTNRRGKPCVALAMHHDSGLSPDSNQRGMPWNKFASAAQYNQIFQKLTNSGYDVITMNQSRVGIDQKTYMLNELCEFVVGYEGGLQHLAHLLQIPCIVLPWRYNDAGGDPEYPGMWYETHRFHADRRTWFLRTVEEFLDWNKQDIHAMIDRLHNLQGNNILFRPGTHMDPDSLCITAANGMDLTPRIMWCETRGHYTTHFIKQHLPLENMQKYPQKSATYTT